MGDSDDDEEVEREYRRNKHKYEAEEEEVADNDDGDEVALQEIFDFDSDIAVLKARWTGEREEVTQSIDQSLSCQSTNHISTCLCFLARIRPQILHYTILDFTVPHNTTFHVSVQLVE